MKNCKKCGKEITKRYNIFCDLSCAIAWNSKNSFKRPRKVFFATCLQCGKTVVGKYKRKFCCPRCSIIYSNLRRSPSSVETRRKTSISAKKHRKENPEFWKQHYKKLAASNASKAIPKECPICKKLFTAGRKYCSPECLSRYFSENRIKNPRKCRGRTGTHKGIYCQSTYELAFTIWALDHKHNVKRSSLQIPYRWEGKQHLYCPDFEIDGVQYEIKGWFHDNAKAKLAAAIEQGIHIEVITKEDCQQYINYVNVKYQVTLSRDFQKFYE